MLRDSQHSRRRFLERSAQAAASAVAAPYFIPRGVLAAPGSAGANDRVGLAIIGFGTRGGQLWGYLPRGLARVVAVCDVNLPRAEAAAAKIDGRPQPFQDYRRILERKDVDAVIVATPDHWHALTTIHACQAGKDVYCEKPLSLTIKEGRAMVTAARKHGRVVQTGSQQRSMEKNVAACEMVINGRAGKIHTVIGNNYPSPWTCQFPGQAVPSGLDWDMWCGQVEPFPYHEQLYICRAQPGWASLRAICGGEICNWGSHGLDQVQMALGMDHTGPVEVSCQGGAIPDYHYTQPQGNPRIHDIYLKELKHQVVYRYSNGIKLRLVDGPRGGAVFIGDRGKITIDRARYSTEPKDLALEPIRDDEIRLPAGSGDVPGHLTNWINCIKTRDKPIADVEIGHRTVTFGHLGNIARWLGRTLEWDPEREVFPHDEEANSYLERPRRKGYLLPEVL